jgi:hypothetical protein
MAWLSRILQPSERFDERERTPSVATVATPPSSGGTSGLVVGAPPGPQSS